MPRSKSGSANGGIIGKNPTSFGKILLHPLHLLQLIPYKQELDL